MTASSNPDENSYTPRDANPREPSGFVYEGPGAPATDTESYAPEREFVLMPLFRRIGELLGIRKPEEPEYIYQTSTEAQPQVADFPRESVSPAHEESSQSAMAELSQPEERPELWAQSHTAESPTNEPVQSAEQPALQAATDEPEMHIQSSESVAEIEAPSQGLVADLPAAEAEAQAPFVQAEHAEIPPISSSDYSPQSSGQDQAPSVSHIPEDPARVTELVAQRSPAPVQPQRKRVAPKRRQKDEIDEAIAALREAASKFSAAISEAVGWLSRKEAEFVRKAERSLAPAPKRRRVPPSRARNATPDKRLPNPLLNSTTEQAAGFTAPAESAFIPRWEPLQFPGLQREAAWKQQAASPPAEQPLKSRQPEASPMYSARHRPALVQRRARVPFWKRIDWAAEFNPTRVAVLGGVVMAMLIIAGITFARRPVSEVLPPQTRPIQPGGVTLTTHPVTTTPTSPAVRPSRATSPAQRQAPPATSHPKRAVAYDNEPDVVTHYYKPKPSPSKQATVAGVKRYSDMD